MDQLTALLEANGCRYATIAVPDTNGLLRGQLVSRAALEKILHKGMPMAPATLAMDPTDVILNLPGYTDESGDFHDANLRVDPESFRVVPWEQEGCNLIGLAQFTGSAAGLCPRSLLQQVLAQAHAMKLQPKYGLELEYTLFNETPESARAKNYQDLQPITAHASHDLVLYQTSQSDWYGDVVAMCQSLDIELAKMHEEIGPGFMEACIAANTGVGPADQAVLFKNYLRALALRRDKLVTYMPRWSEHADSQSTHVHVSLLDDSGKPVFFDADGDHTMSPCLRHFIGGLQAHLGDLMLLFAPTVNAYRRFVDGTFAPPALTWGYENRTSCLRVVGDSPDSIRVENRLPGSDANPYLIGAATIAAGLAGLRDSVEPSPELVGNGYSQVAPETLQFPRTMVAAIDQFRNSIFAREWLGDMFVDGFTATRECQEMEFRSKVPDTEKQRFFELG